MNALEKYSEHLRESGNPGLADAVIENAHKANKLFLRDFDYASDITVLLLGNVQSGKTAQMFGIICEASKDFPVFLLLTTDNVTLQEQTLERVNHDLGDSFCVCGEHDNKKFEQNSLQIPTIVVLKKNQSVLKNWADVFASTGFMRGNPLFILDDEADASSLNTKVNQNKVSAINMYLQRIRKDAIACIYLQVTGTPQAVLLQTVFSNFKPAAVQYFKPGKGYLGGDFFFPQPDQQPENIEFLDESEHPLRDSVVHHLVVSAQLLLSGSDVSNALYHPGMLTGSHFEVLKYIKDDLFWGRSHINDEFLEAAKTVYENMHPEKSEKLPFETLWPMIKDLLNGKAEIITMNSKTDQTDYDHTKGCNFIIGGNTLGRGVTFPKLNTVYYSRTAKSPQADTMWQHARMFGYDRDPGLIKVWITRPLYKKFAEINAANNSIIAQIENGLENIKITYPKGLNPTRKNVLDNKNVFTLYGGTNMYPSDPENKDIGKLDQMLEPFLLDPHYQVSLRLLINILKEIIPSSDFDQKWIIEILESLAAEKSSAQGMLIVRTDRKVNQGTGALLSPNDWKLGNQFDGLPVLTIYKIDPSITTWKQIGLWVPNIKLPGDRVYYNTK